MRIQTTLGAAIAAILLTGAAQAGPPSLDRTVTRDLAAPAAGIGGQRFVVKTTVASAPGRAALTGALGTSVRRAGLATAVQATTTAAARPAATARVLRSMGAPGWHVVQASRALTASEQASFIRELSAEPGVLKVEPDRLYQRADVAAPPRHCPPPRRTIPTTRASSGTSTTRPVACAPSRAGRSRPAKAWSSP